MVNVFSVNTITLCGIKMVVCKHCNEKFTPLWEDSINQANGCASSIFTTTLEKRFLASGYGSDFDGELYEVLTDEYRNGIICDTCVEEGIKQDKFKLVSKNNYFGLDFGV